jgi:hypothetical protein
MERLRTQDFQGLIEFPMDGYDVGDLDAFARHRVRALPKLVPCCGILLQGDQHAAGPDELDRRAGRGHALSRMRGDHQAGSRDTHHRGSSRTGGRPGGRGGARVRHFRERTFSTLEMETRAPVAACARELGASPSIRG